MPEIRESTQPVYSKAVKLSGHFLTHGLAGGTGHLHGTTMHACLHQVPPARSVLSIVTVPDAVAPIVVSVVAILAAGLVRMVGKYLSFYARNRRARSIAYIRKAAIEGKITVSAAQKLIRADVEADAVPQQVADGDRTGEDCRTDNDSEGRHPGQNNAPMLSAIGRVVLMLRRAHLL